MAVLVTDPILEKQLRDEWEATGSGREEVWDGVLVMPASPNTEHQLLVSKLNTIFSGLMDWDRGDMTLPGGNVSDRVDDWMHNYRIPDVLVFLAGGAARNCGAHWYGGLDFLVEITSPGEEPEAKLDFYSRLRTRELLVVERNPWALELYQLGKKKLVSAGRSDLANPAVLASGVLSLTFQLQAGEPRPVIGVAHRETGQQWKV